MGCQGGSSLTSGQCALSFNCASCTINSILKANSATFSAITNNGILSQTSYIKMTNAINIYLKSATDVNNYIKYDATYDGVRLVGNASITFKDISGNISLQSTPTLLNLNKNTSFTGTLSTSSTSTFNDNY